MTDREKLTILIKEAHKKCKAQKNCHVCEVYGNGSDCVYMLIANHLIANGVNLAPVVRCKNCCFSYKSDVVAGGKVVQKSVLFCGNPEAPWFNEELSIPVKDESFCSYGKRSIFPAPDPNWGRITNFNGIPLDDDCPDCGAKIEGAKDG